MSDGSIDITGLNPAAVLAALYNGSQQLGMGRLHARGAEGMTVEQAEEELKNNPDGYFDYLHGRVMKIDMSRNPLETRLYDRDNGQGAAEAIINRLRA